MTFLQYFSIHFFPLFIKNPSPFIEVFYHICNVDKEQRQLKIPFMFAVKIK